MSEGKKDLKAAAGAFKKNLEIALHNPFFLFKVKYKNSKYKLKKNFNSILDRGYKTFEDFKF